MLKKCILLMFYSILLFSCKQKISEKDSHLLLDSGIITRLLKDTTQINPSIDSLKTLLRKIPTDTQQVTIINALAEEWISINPIETKKLAEEALVLSSDLNFQQGVADAINNLGLYYYYIDVYDSALHYFHQSFHISQNLKSKIALGKSQYGIGNVLRFTGKYDSAMIYFDRAIAHYETEIKRDSNSIPAQKGLAATYDKVGNIYTSKGDYRKSLEYTQKSLFISQLLGDKRATSYSMHTLAIGYYYLGDMDKALDFNRKSLKIRQELGDKVGTASSLQNIGLIYNVQGDVDNALEYFHQSLRIKEEINDRRGAGYSYFHIGVIYKDQRDWAKALEYYRKGLDIREEIGDKNGVGYLLNHEGEVYLLMAHAIKGSERTSDTIQKLIVMAKDKFARSLQLFEQTSDRYGLANSLQSLGRASLEEGDLPRALSVLEDCLKIFEEIGNKNGVTETLIYIAQIYHQRGNAKKAIEMSTRSYQLAKELGSPEKVKEASLVLHDIYLNRGNHSQALLYFKESVLMRDSVSNIKNKQIAEKRHWQFEYEKKAITDSLMHTQAIRVKNLELEKKEEQTKRQQIALYALGFVILSVIILVFLIYRGYRIKRNANRVITEKNSMLEQAYEEIKATSEALSRQNEKLKDQNEEITKQRNEIESQRNSLANLAWELQEKGEEIETQRNMLSSQNKEITDSIVYAQRIQNAVLPSEEFLGQLFVEHFILYKPKSIVSGDFYWATRVRTHPQPFPEGRGKETHPQPFPEGRGKETHPRPFPEGREEEERVYGYNTADPMLYKLLKDKAEEMKNNPTEAEAILWNYLRTNQPGHHFRRQHIIDRYIADFVCLKKRLIVEVEGKKHDYTADEDALRTNFLNQKGYRVIRFKNEEVLSQPDEVVSRIRQELDKEPMAIHGEEKVLPLGENLGGALKVLPLGEDLGGADLLIFCVTDCTGHGVPGAFMSMMGVSFLNEIVRKEEVTNAAAVLDELRRHVVSSMEETGDGGVQLDGMDIGLCVLNTKTLKLQFAGANIPCWVATPEPKFDEGNSRIEVLNGLVELKPDRMPIGRYERMEPFNLIELQLQKNDKIYISTDGFSDQFGGPDEKKFQKNRLMDLLCQINGLPHFEQKNRLETAFEAWRNSRNQIDDVTILGIRV